VHNSTLKAENNNEKNKKEMWIHKGRDAGERIRQWKRDKKWKIYLPGWFLSL
jgi:hypothetical protein